MKKFLLCTLVLSLLSFAPVRTGNTNDGYHIVGNTKEKFLKIFDIGKALGNFDYQKLTHAILPEFEGLPYGAGGVACPGNKTLVNFTSFDCVTFVESQWSLMATFFLFQNEMVKADADPFEVFASNLNRIRYFGGENCGIEDRIHYFTQQMLELERAGLVFNVAVANGDIFTKKINYISKNESRYGDLSQSSRMVSVEKVLNNTVNYFYAKERLDFYYPLAQSGDIVAFASNEPGLDVSHTGIIVVEDGDVRFTHASSAANKVVHRQDLDRYVKSHSSCSGIFVFRPKFNAPKRRK